METQNESIHKNSYVAKKKNLTIPKYQTKNENKIKSSISSGGSSDQDRFQDLLPAMMTMLTEALNNGNDLISELLSLLGPSQKIDQIRSDLIRER